MKLLRGVLVTTLLCGLGHIARADDFQMIVIDPNFTVEDITTTTFNFAFTGCDSGQAPAGYAGCFTGENLTGVPITSLTINVSNLIPNVGAPGVQPAGCDSSISQTFFSACSAQTVGNGYVLNFSGGSIPSGQFLQSEFTIAEQGADPSEFGTMTAVINSVTAVTPEPDSLLLLSTGMLSGAAYLVRRRLR